MDVLDFINNGGQKTILNPNYNPKSKKNIQPPTITVADLDPERNSAVDMAVYDFNRQYSIGAKEADSYRTAGLNWNPWENLDKQMAEQQGALSKFGNALAQTVVSEVGLGTAIGITDLFDMIGQSVGLSDPNYQNAVSKYLTEKQEEFKEATKIWVDPDKNIFNGGLLDAGWWASNIPSIASSLTLLIPSTGVVKGLSWAGKASKTSRFTRNAVRTFSRAEKAIKEGRELNKVQRWLNAPSTIAATNLFIENGTTAALSRAMENYQEARQTYNDMYANASEAFKNMSDEEYAKVVERSQNIIAANGIDSNDRDAVAKVIAKTSADRTFQMDWLNVGWDVLQMYGLRNAWKGLKNAPDNPVAVRRANLDAAKYFGKSADEIAKLKAQRTLSEKFGEKLSDFMYGSKLTIGAELSEGAEEALNYIAQQEGIHFGNVFLGTEQGSRETGMIASVKSLFDTRTVQYIMAPELWDAAFWGVMGGVVFQGLGSQFRRISNKFTDKSEADKEATKQLPWYELDELPEIKRRKAEIEARGIDFNEYAGHMEKIDKNIDIYNLNPDGTERQFTSNAEKEVAKKRLKEEYITKMTLRAMNSGNLDMLKAFLADDNVRKGMVERGIFNEEGKTKTDQELEQESKKYIEDALDIMEKVERSYNEELIALNYAATNINAKRRKENKEANIFSTIPAEYLQIMAVNNIKTKMAIETLNQEKVRVEQRISELETQFEKELDKNLPYRNAIRTAVLTATLGQLRAERKRLVSQEEKSLSNQFAIENIDKKIETIEDKLEAEDLAYATWMSLRYVKGDDGKFTQEDTEESIAYKDTLIEKSLGETLSAEFNIPGLEHLSSKSRTSLAGDAAVGKFKTMEADYAEVYRSLRNISPELDELYQETEAIDYRIDSAYKDIVHTTDDVEHEASMLNNTMNEVRVKAINEANKIIQDLYEKYGEDVQNALYDRVKSNYQEKDWNSDTSKMTKFERKMLSDAIDVLNLSKDANKSLVDKIEELFRVQDMIKAGKELSAEFEESTKESESSTTLNLTDTDANSVQPMDSSASIQEGSDGLANGQIGDISQVTDPQNIENRNPTSYAKWYPKRGKLESSRPNSTDNGGSAIYDNGDGTFTIDVRNNAQMLNNPVMFSNTNEVDLTRPYEVEELPIAKKRPNGKLEIVSPGRLVNTDTLEYQQEQEEKAQQEQAQQEGGQKIQNEETFYTQVTPTTIESTPATETPASTPSEEDLTSGTQPTIFSTGKQELTTTATKEHKYIGIGGEQTAIVESKPISLDKLKKGDVFFGYNNQRTTFLGKYGNNYLVESYGQQFIIGTEYSGMNWYDWIKTNPKVYRVAKPSTKSTTSSTGERESNSALNVDSAPKTKSFEEVVNQAPAGDEINNEALGKFMAAARANHDVDLDAMANKMISEYVVKGSDRAIAESAINKAKNIIQRKLDRLKANNNETTMRSSIDEVLITQSSITELISDTPEVKAYKDAVRMMINQYAKEVGIRKINDKIYINLEDLLRYTNEVTTDSETAAMLYTSMKTWLMSNEAQKEFVTTDKEEINKADFLKKVARSARDRYIERLADISTHRVDIRSIVKAWNDIGDTKSVEEFYEALDELQPGDNLHTKQVGALIHIKDSKGRTVGTLPIPKINKTTGAYEVYNDGWKTDVLAAGNGNIRSEFKNLLIRWLTSNDAACQELNDIIFQLAYDNLTEEEQGNLLIKLEQNPEWIRAQKIGFTSNTATRNQLAEGLVKLWKFTKRNNDYDRTDYEDLINESLDTWFQKLKFSYDAVKALEKGAGGLAISVATISDGELIRIVENDKIKAQQEALPANEAIAGGVNPEIHKIAVADKMNKGWLDVSGMPIQPLSGVFEANTFVLIPNRSGRPGYVHAYPAEVADDYIGSDAKEMMKAIHDEVNRLLNEHANNPSAETYNAIKEFFRTLTDYKNENRTLFNGLTFADFGNGFSVTMPETNNYFIVYAEARTGGASTLITVGNDSYPANKKGKKTQNFPFSSTDAHKAVQELINNLSFKLNYSYIHSDNVSDQPMKGFATKRNGKFEINIAGKTWRYNSFNEFILNNNLVRLNTKPSEDGKSNYHRRGIRSQAANQVLEIKIAKTATPPVGNNRTASTAANPVPEAPVTISLSDKTKSILESTDANVHKGNDIASLIFSNEKDKDKLNALKNLDILPKNIIFDPEFNNRQGYAEINADINTKTGQVTVGSKWLGMFTNPLTQQQAIRKLIHEQLHYKLHKKRGFVRSAKEIYDAYKEALDKEGLPVNDHMRAYLFEGESEEVALEEFLVETLTSKELADKLNSIDIPDINRRGGTRNLLQKLMELMRNVFGWDIRKGSLYEKEFYTLKETFKDTTNETKAKEATAETVNEIIDDNTKEILDDKVTTKDYEDSKIPETPQIPTVVPPINPSPVENKFGDGSGSKRMRGKFKKSSVTEDVKVISEINDIKAKAIADGTFMKAPNGNPTNLNEIQWLQVRTKAFKKWFGDWENNSSEASKVVDENGEPRVMYHGSSDLFDTFSYDFFGRTDPGDNGKGFCFAYRKETAKNYGDNIYPVFLNVKHPFIHIGFDTQSKVKGFNRTYNPTNREILQKRIDSISRKIELDKEALEEYKEDEFHISILNKRISYNQTLLNSLQQELSTKPKDYLDSKLYDTLDEYDGVMEQDEHYQVVVRNSNQIKSATNNIGIFSTIDDNIRHSSITEYTPKVSSIIAFIDRLPISQQAKFSGLLERGEIESACQ